MKNIGAFGFFDDLGSVSAATPPPAGEVNVSVGATGAGVDFQYQISPPDPWQGEVNAVGFAPEINRYDADGLLGEVNAEGFAASAGITREFTSTVGVANAEGFIPTVGISVEGVNVSLLGTVNAQGFSAAVSLVFDATSLLGEVNAEGFAGTVGLGYDASPTTGYANAQGYAAKVIGAVTSILGEAQAEGFAANIEFDYRPSVGEVTFTGFSPAQGLAGEINFAVGSTGATVEFVKFIEPPSTWYGTVNAQGFEANAFVSNALLGQVNATGFAPEVIADYITTKGVVNVTGATHSIALNNEQTALLGEVYASGYAAAINATLTTTFAEVGEIHTYRLGYTATVETIKDIEGPTLGQAHAVGYAATAIDILGEEQAKLGEVNVEGFAPLITSVSTKTAQLGETQAQGFAATVTIVRDATVTPAVGLVHAEGKLGDVLPEGGDFISATTGTAQAQGFAGVVTIQRTARAVAGQVDITGAAHQVAGGTLVSSLVGFVYVNGRAPRSIGTSGWIPIARAIQTWTPSNEASSNWATISRSSTTWTEIEEAS